jgi:hypothetical protein
LKAFFFHRTKIFSAHVIPGLFLLTISYLSFNPYLCVAVVTLSLGFNGAATLTNLQNSQDLAPNFAGMKLRFHSFNK